MNHNEIDYWKSYQNPLINNLLVNLEAHESSLTLTLSEETRDTLEGLLAHLCKADFKAQYADLLTDVLSQLPSAYLSYFLAQLAKHNGAFFKATLDHVVGLPSSHARKAVLERAGVVEKLQTLVRIFNDERVERVTRILETM
ncbi:type IVB secretion system protein IcmW [Cysteiniphilum sp. 6C5]